MPETRAAAPPTDVLQLDCRTCGAALVFEPHLRTAECPYCASPNVVERPPSPDRPRPALAVGFGVDRERALEIARRWLASRGPFAHSGLPKAALERTRGIYLPAYLYSAAATADYSAMIGEHYTVTETYTTTDSKGRTTTHTRTRTETEWRSLAGRRETWEAEVIVSASSGLPNAELEAVEPFDLRVLRAYRSRIVAGWIAEEPSIDRASCLRTARAETLARLEREVQAFLPGDSQRAVETRVRVDEESAELALLPIWVLAVRYAEDRDPLRLVINGQTGKTAARVPLSAPKIALAVLLALALIAALVVVFGGGGR